MNPIDFCKFNNIVNYTINDDGSIDVDGDVWLSNIGFEQLPVKFSRVNGGFYISNNGLVSLVGSPNWVSGNFSCFNNYLTNLIGSPSYVGSHYNSRSNNIKSIFGAPSYVGGNFYSDLKTSDGFELEVDRFKILNYENTIKLINRHMISKKITKM